MFSPHGQRHAGAIRSFILQSELEPEAIEIGTAPSVISRSCLSGISQNFAKMNMLCRYLTQMRIVDVASTLEGRQRQPKVPKCTAHGISTTTKNPVHSWSASMYQYSPASARHWRFYPTSRRSARGQEMLCCHASKNPQTLTRHQGTFPLLLRS